MWLFTLKAMETYSSKRETFNWSRGTGSEPQSTPGCNISQKRSDHYDLQTSLQAVVTNNQLLAAQFTRVRDPLLVKTCQEGGGKQRLRMRNWGKGQAWMLQLLLWNWTWMSCKGTAVFQPRGLGCPLWHRGYSALYIVHIHQLCSPGCSSVSNTDHARCCRVSSHDAGLDWTKKLKICMNVRLLIV